MRFLVFVISVFAFHQSYSQLDIGLKGGLNYSDISYDNYKSLNLKDISSNPEVGFHAGLYARLHVIAFYLQSEILYSQINGVVNYQGENDHAFTDDFQLHRLDVPILLGASIGPINLIAGPVASFNLNSASEIYEYNFKQGTWGLQGGVGFEFWRMNLELKYETAISDYSREINVTIGEEIYNLELDTRNSLFIFSIGYRLN